MRKLQLFGLNADRGACGHYRVLDPLNTLADQGHSVGFMEGHFIDEEETLDYMKNCDVFVFQRPRSAKQLAFFETFKQDPNKLLVFEHDDNTWDLHPFSDHFRWHGTTDIAMPIPKLKEATGLSEADLIAEANKEGKTVKDGMIWLWEHGKNGYNVLENSHKRKIFERCLALADVITATTPTLANLFTEKAREFGNDAKAYDLPNCLDLRRWMPVEIKHQDVRILWQGGASHQPDLKVIQEALEIVCKKFPQVKLVFGGLHFPGITANIDPKQVEAYDNWTEYTAHPYRMALFGADINVVPIENIYFNSFKSDIKVSEAAALGIPSVASNLTPYKESIIHDKTGLLADNTTDSWVKHLSALVKSETLRKGLGASARAWVEKNRDIKKEAHRWADVYAAELDKKRKNTPSLPQPSSPESKDDSTTPRGKTSTPTSSRKNSSSPRRK